jgi:uncharacterized membrane protein YkvA (DUF1232 family)
MQILEQVRTRLSLLKRDIAALWFAAHDRRTPWPAKALAGLVVAYALSPLDLIPDVVPILGQIDNLVILPLGIFAVVRLIPGDLWREFRVIALDASPRPPSIAGIAVVLTLWLAVGASLAWTFWPVTRT